MKIRKQDVFAVADELYASGNLPTVDGVQAALKCGKHSSGGNRNSVNAALAQWYDERGLPRKGRRAVRPMAAAAPAKNVTPKSNRLKVIIRQLILLPVIVVKNVVGAGRDKEQIVADQLTENAEAVLQKELDELRAQTGALQDVYQRLNAEVQGLKAQFDDNTGAAGNKGAELEARSEEYVFSGAATAPTAGKRKVAASGNGRKSRPAKAAKP